MSKICPDAGQSPRAPEYCELCAPPGFFGAVKHARYCERKSGHCYCGKPLPPWTGGAEHPPIGTFDKSQYMGELNYAQRPTHNLDEWAAKISRMESEVREWRAVAAKMSLAPGPVETPTQFMAANLNAIVSLLEKATSNASDAAEAKDLLRRMLNKVGGTNYQMPNFEADKGRANAFLGCAPTCGYCNKPDPDTTSIHPLFVNEPDPGSEKVHAACQTKARREAFLALTPELRKAMLDNI